MLEKMKQIPLDMKVFIVSGLLIGGIFLFPSEERYHFVFTMYLSSIFLSMFVSSTYMTYLNDSKYNWFRNATTKMKQVKIIVFYLIGIGILSFIIAWTDLLLYIF